MRSWGRSSLRDKPQSRLFIQLAYDMTRSMHRMLGVAVFSRASLCASTAYAECSIAIPTSTSTSSYGTLQLPVDANGDGKPDTVSGSQLSSYSGQFFERQTAARIVMRVPTSGLATTPNSKYPRSELKENRTWNVDDGCAAQAARVKSTICRQAGTLS